MHGVHAFLIALASVPLALAKHPKVVTDANCHFKGFESFLQRYGKTYTNDELQKRFQIFKVNCDFIEAQNAKGNSYTLGLTSFADLSPEEFARIYNASTPVDHEVVLLKGIPSLGTHVFSGASLPTEVDWRAKGAVTSVKNQGLCGSCWAFATAGAIESAWQLAARQLASLSTQQFVDCSHQSTYGCKGCQGGNAQCAVSYATQAGLCNDASYPYAAKDGKTCLAEKCSVVIPKHGVVGYKSVDPSDERALLEALAQQPVAANINGDSIVFQLYRGGVLSSGCGTTINHAVLLVGYGTDNGQDYWLAKNSWGDSWGEHGYIRLARGQAGPGECGIKQSAQVFPVVDGSKAKPVDVKASLIAAAVLGVALCIIGFGCCLLSCKHGWFSRRDTAPLLQVQEGRPRQVGIAASVVQSNQAARSWLPSRKPAAAQALGEVGAADRTHRTGSSRASRLVASAAPPASSM